MELDPKEVLYHLNQMGYKNITATQLKNFMKGQCFWQENIVYKETMTIP